VTQPAPVVQPVSSASPAVPAAAAGTAPTTGGSAQPSPDLFSTAPQSQRTRPNEISVSGDYLLGKGHVTLPLGFSLAKIPQNTVNIVRAVSTPSRSSDYYGATISYSYGQSWFIDLSFAEGNSTGSADVALGGSQPVPSNFTIKDDWYQAYLRYTFPGLRGKRLSAYLRAGFSYVTADLTDDSTFPGLGLYHQTDHTTDYLGNLGFGVGYSLYRSSRVRWALQLEGEGFYGDRTQESLETLPQANFFSAPFQTATIDNTLYGGIGRGTVRFEYRLGQSGAFRVFVDGGIEGKYTKIHYSQVGTPDELLWGPYAKVGVRYSF
jgi:hypothetical protein